GCDGARVGARAGAGAGVGSRNRHPALASQPGTTYGGRLMKRLLTLALFAALGCSGSSTPKSAHVRGAGSTFVYPLMVLWSHDYEGHEGGCKIEYMALGSHGGIKYIMEKKGDFACSDAPMTDDELAKGRAGGDEIVHVPLVLGAVVPVYNLPEVKES